MKVKNLKYILFSVFCASLLIFTSCTNLLGDLGDNCYSDSDAVVLKVSLGSEGARTALPEFNSSDISFISLTYCNESGTELDFLGMWDSVTALNQQSISFKTGTYLFTITAICNDIKMEETQKIEIKNGKNNLSFSPVITDFNYEYYGSGSLNICVNFAPEKDKVKKVTAGLYTKDGNQVPDFADEELNISSEGKVFYTKTAVASGCYIVVFKFYADEEKTQLLGTYREYAAIIDRKVSSSNCNIEALGRIFTITYETAGGEFTENFTAPGSYTRLSTEPLVLPTAQNISNSDTGLAFAGWYDNKLLEGEPVTEILPGTSGNKTFYAKWAKSIKITFVTNQEGVTLSTNTQIVPAKEKTALLTAEQLGLSHYKVDPNLYFKGWNTDKDSKKILYRDCGIISLEEDITLYAVWQKLSLLSNSNIDSDGDGLTDSEEINLYHTDPTNPDTDGDNWTDGEEISLHGDGYNSFNPLIADVPELTVRMTGKPSINYIYTLTTGESTTESVTTNDGYTGSETNTNSRTQTQSTTHGWAVNTGIKYTVGFAGGDNVGWRNLIETHLDGGYNYNVTTGDSYTYSKSASESWSKSWSNGKSSTNTSSKTVTGGVVMIPVRFQNPSNIAYTVEKLTVALYRNPVNSASSREFVRNLTLSGDSQFTILPHSESGDYYLTADLSVGFTEQLLKYSTGFQIEISGYKISLQKDKAFSNDFTEALTQVKAKTASVYIDWGSDSGRTPRVFNVSVKNQYNSSASSISDLYTKPSLDYVFQTMLHYEKNTDYTLSKGETGHLESFLSDSLGNDIFNQDAVTDGGWFILHTYTKNGQRYQNMYAPDQSGEYDWSFDNIILSAGDEVKIFYSVDKDKDGVPLNEELIYGTSDDAADTDGDGLTDYDEIYGWYKDGIGLDPKYSVNNKVYSSPILKDTDGDDLVDYSSGFGIQDNDPLVPKNPSDTSLGTVQYSTGDGKFQDFEFGTDDYKELSGFTENIYLNITSKLAFGTVKYNTRGDDKEFYDEVSPDVPIKLDVGDNKIYIQCTAPDGTTKNVYTINAKAEFRPLKNFKVYALNEGGGVSFTWNSYGDGRAVEDDGVNTYNGGYILYCKKESKTSSPSLTRDNIGKAVASISKDLENKDEFYLKLDADTLSKGLFSIENRDLKIIAANTNYSFYLFAYTHSDDDTKFKTVMLASENILTSIAKKAKLKFYAHYFKNVCEHDDGWAGEYFWNVQDTSGIFKLNSLSRGAGQRVEMEDSYNSHFCFGESSLHDSAPSRFSDCTKTFEKEFERGKDYSFKIYWNAYEHDTFSDDWLGQCVCEFKYNAKKDTWNFSWSSAGPSGEGVNQKDSGSLKAGERSTGKKWQILNKSSGEVELYWDWSWDYTDD